MSRFPRKPQCRCCVRPCRHELPSSIPPDRRAIKDAGAYGGQVRLPSRDVRDAGLVQEVNGP